MVSETKPLKHTMPESDREVQDMVQAQLGVRPCLWQIKAGRRYHYCSDRPGNRLQTRLISISMTALESLLSRNESYIANCAAALSNFWSFGCSKCSQGD